MAITGINTLDGKQIIAAGASSAISAQQALQTSGGNDLQGLYDFVSSNSGSWTGGEITGDYYPASNPSGFIPSSNNNVAFGAQNNISNSSFAFGTKNTAENTGIAFGKENKSNYGGIVGGYQSTALDYSFAQGRSDSASWYSVAIGSGCKAYYFSESFGQGNIAKTYQMAIGKFNKTADNASFIIGNGTSTADRNNIFIIYNNGSVSAAGNISANGYEMKPIAVVATSADATGSNILYVVTGS